MKKYINNLIIIIFIFMFAIFASGCKGKEKNKEADKDFFDVDYMFEVVKHNGEVVSGKEDIYNFYLITKESNNKALLAIITQTDDDVRKVLVYYDGNTYNYYEVQDKEKELIGNYKYLNYSKSIAMGIYS
ncbi:MAG: hypothetical protein J6X02_01130, partial [Bacilli bacterium]|nr:hypothetical protein [Bacilli bacterium]